MSGDQNHSMDAAKCSIPLGNMLGDDVNGEVMGVFPGSGISRTEVARARMAGVCGREKTPGSTIRVFSRMSSLGTWKVGQYLYILMAMSV